jgi:uncharacterized repeat protein (TIGR01451 family)
MGNLHKASKLLLVAALAIAPVIADDTPFASDSPEPSAQKETTAKSAARAKAESASCSDEACQQLFFSAGGEQSALPDNNTPQPPLKRVKMKASIRPLVSTASEQVTAADSAKNSAEHPEPSQLHLAIFEATDDQPAKVRQVAASDDTEPARQPVADRPEFDFAETIAGKDAEQPASEEAAFEPTFEAVDAEERPFEELDEPEIEFNVEEQEPTELGARPRELFEGPKPVPGPAAAIPNSNSDSLPTVHTGVQQPSVEVSWVGTDTFNIGQECQCSLIVKNTGDSLVRSVTVEAAIPAGLRVVSATPAPQPDTSRWAVGDLQPGQTQTVELVMIPVKRGSIALNAFVRFTGYSTSVIEVQEPVLRVAVQGPDTVTVGEHAGYMVRVENPGTGTVHNVVIEARIPEGLQHRSGAAPRIHVGTLNPGESRQARLNLMAVEGGERLLAVRAEAEGGLSDEAGTQISVAKPSLNVAISGPETTSAGEPTDYEVTVTNTGNIPSINVRANYRLPENAQFLRADRGGVHHKADRLIDWFVGTIQPGESASYRVTLEANTPGTALHRAGVVSEHTTVTLVSHTTTVQETPELFLDVATAEPAPSVGEETTVRIMVQNDGTVAADKVGLSCELPSGLEFISAAGPTEFLAENGVVIFRSLESIQAGSDASWLIKARCVRSGGHRVRVRVGSPSMADPVIGEGTVRTRNAE